MQKPFHLMLVEDNEGDIELTRIAFAEAGLPVELSVAHDGREALDYLSLVPPFGNTKKPDLILLDLNMPRMNGKELLNVLKQDEHLKTIPVIIYSTSSSHGDIMDSYRSRANCYIVKPSALPEFIAVARQVDEYWHRIALLPSGEAA